MKGGNLLRLKPFCVSGMRVEWRLGPFLRLKKVSGLKGSMLRRDKVLCCRADGAAAEGGYPPQYVGTTRSASTFDNPLYVDGAQTSVDSNSSISPNPPRPLIERIEDSIERAIFDCRFLTLFAVIGSLLGSTLCFLQGSLYVVHSFKEFFRAYIHRVRGSQVILYLVEAVDVYLMGTVMLIFGMGLYELFVSSLNIPGKRSKNGCDRASRTIVNSNLFGLFTLEERPAWLEIRSLDELKTKLGHVIVMILLVGMFEKSKRVPIHSGLDLLCFAGSILLASSCLYMLSLLHNSKDQGKTH